MSNETQILELLQKIERRTRQKQTWVSALWINDLTGWNGDRLRQARKQGIVKYRDNKTGGIEYLLESVPEVFIKKSKAVEAQ